MNWSTANHCEGLWIGQKIDPQIAAANPNYPKTWAGRLKADHDQKIKLAFDGFRTNGVGGSFEMAVKTVVLILIQVPLLWMTGNAQT